MNTKNKNAPSTMKKVSVLAACILLPLFLIVIPMVMSFASEDEPVSKDDASNSEIVFHEDDSVPVESTEMTAEKQAKIDAAEFISERDLALAVKDPTSHAGDIFKVWGEISQFDSATGTDTFRAYISHAQQQYWATNGENAILIGDSEELSDFVKDDLFVAVVEVASAETYENVAGGGNTVPTFVVHKIEHK